jgi:hypothetical protein
MNNEQERKKLRKQPQRRRVRSTTAVHLPELQVPKTAAKRRRRQKTQPVRFGLATLTAVVFNARWISLAVLAACIYGLFYISNEPRFYLTYIPVEGAVALSPQEIAAASGLAGSHVFAADPGAAADRIAALPGIVSSTVTLQWPNQVFIHVEEEAPVAIWIENGIQYGITAGGRLIPAAHDEPNLLQIVSEMDPPPITTPTGQGTPSELLAAASVAGEALTNDDDEPGIVAELPETGLAFIPKELIEGALQLRELRPGIDQLYFRPSGGLSYQDGRGWRGYFGTGTDMNQKLAVYETLIDDLLARGIQPAYISVSNQEKPYYMTQ